MYLAVLGKTQDSLLEGIKNLLWFKSCVPGTRSSWMRRGPHPKKNPHNREDTEKKPRKGSEGGPPSKDSVLLRDRQGERHRREDMGRWRQSWEGGGHQLRATWSPQTLEEAGRTLPWSLWREHRGYRGPAPQNVAPKAEPQ